MHDVERGIDPADTVQNSTENEKPRKGLKTIYIVMTVLTIIAFVICIFATAADLASVIQGKKTFMEFLGDLLESLM